MGILMDRKELHTVCRQESQSPKAGHGYSNFSEIRAMPLPASGLNPLKRVMGILMAVTPKFLK